MNEYSPKPDLWSKIQQRKDFDSQVKAHVSNLPERMPKADLWSAIEPLLDQKTPVIPLWKYGMAAASIALILAFSSIAYLHLGEKVVNTQLSTEANTTAPTHSIIDENVNTETGPSYAEPKQIAMEKPQTMVTQKQSNKREMASPIQLPEPDLTDLNIENIFISEVIIPPTPEKEVPKTLHQVSISWSKIKPRMKVKTQFGQQELELGQKSQASVDPIGQVTIEINN